MTCRLHPNVGLRPSIPEEKREDTHTGWKDCRLTRYRASYGGLSPHRPPVRAHGRGSHAHELHSTGPSRALLACGCSHLCDSGLRHICKDIELPSASCDGWRTVVHGVQRGREDIGRQSRLGKVGDSRSGRVDGTRHASRSLSALCPTCWVLLPSDFRFWYEATVALLCCWST